MAYGAGRASEPHTGGGRCAIPSALAHADPNSRAPTHGRPHPAPERHADTNAGALPHAAPDSHADASADAITHAHHYYTNCSGAADWNANDPRSASNADSTHDAHAKPPAHPDGDTYINPRPCRNRHAYVYTHLPTHGHPPPGPECHTGPCPDGDTVGQPRLGGHLPGSSRGRL
jgi:hypothetical protein